MSRLKAFPSQLLFILLLFTLSEAGPSSSKFNCEDVLDGNHALDTFECLSSFVICSNGFAHDSHCPPSLVYDPVAGVCDQRKFVTVCGGQPRVSTVAPPPSTTVKVDFDCSQLLDGDYNLRPGECSSSFVKCSNNHAWLVNCPPRLSFDPDKKLCEDPEFVTICGGSPRVSEPTETTISFDCPKPEGRFPLPSILCSSSYIVCSSGVARVGRCALGELYDSTVGQCRSSSQVSECSFNCKGRPNGMYAGAGCSATYWWCWNGKATKHTCQAGFFFQDGQCSERMSVVACGGKRTTIATTIRTPTSTGTIPIDCSTLSRGDYAHPSGCSNTYYSCSNHIGFERHCPGFLIYDADRNLCARRYEVAACGGKPPSNPPTLPPTTTTATEPTSSFACPSPFGDFPDPERPCTKFYYWCEKNQPALVRCMEPRIFSSSRGECIQPEDAVECQPSTPATPGFICPEPFGDFLDLDRPCTKFYYWCENNQASRVECVGTRIYSSSRGECVQPEDSIECQPSTPAAPAFKCPEPLGDFPDPDRPCTRFYYWCGNNQASLVECLDGKIFSAIKGECVPRENAPDCRTTKLPSTKPTTTTSTTTATPAREPSTTPPLFDCPVSFGDFPVPEQPCTKFYYWCGNNRASLVECLDDKIYSASRGECVPAEDAPNCRLSTPATPGFACPQPLGDFPDPDRPCTKYYYWCGNDQASLVECLDGKIYSAAQGECVFLTNAPDCISPTPATPGFPCPAPVGDFPDPDRPCTKYYYWCENNRASLVECVGPRIYSSSRAECVQPENAIECQSSTPAAPGFICPQPLGDFPDPDQPCTKYYYWCGNNEASLVECLDGKIYSARRGECVFQSNAPDCTAPTPAAPRFDCPESLGDFPDPGRPCTRFYYWCGNNKASLVECLDGKIFSAIKGECVPGENAPDCRTSKPPSKPTTTTTTTTTTETPAREPSTTASLFDCPTAFGDFPDPERPCTKFYYWCGNNRPSLVECLDGKIYSATKGECVLSRDAPDCRSSTPANPVFVCPQRSGDFPDPERPCTKFYYWCGNNRASLVECLDGKIFSATKGECVLSPNAPDCLPPTPANPVFVCPQRSGDFADPERPCTRFYYWCGNNRASLVECLDDKIFSATRGECVFPPNAPDCRPPTPAAPGFACLEPFGDFPDPDRPCTKFYYWCGDNRASLVECLDGKIYSSVRGECALLEDAPGCRVSSPGFVCPASLGDFPDPDRPCTKYYYWCSLGRASLVECLDGKIFSAIREECVLINNAPDCKPAPTTTTAAAPGFVCPEPFGDFPDPDRPCTKFYYWCENSRASLVECLDAKVYSSDRGECAQIENSPDCRVSTPVFVCPASLGDFPVPDRPCSKYYYWCSRGRASLVECLDGKIFSAIREECVLINNAPDCKTTTKAPTTTTVTTAAAPGFVCPEPVGDFPDPDRPCTKFYYWCNNGQPSLVECLDDKIYSAAAKECVTGARALDCRGPTAASPGFQCPVPLGDFADPDRPCSKFYYWCSNNRAQLIECLDGKIFSAIKGECVIASDASECQPSTPATPGFVCPVPFGDFPDPSRPCTMFYYWCESNRAQVVKCLEGTIFSAIKGECVTERDAPDCQPPTPAAPGFVCPAPFGDFPDPQQPCSKFYYWCQDNKPELVECLDDKIYSPSKELCDVVESVPECSVQTSPSDSQCDVGKLRSCAATLHSELGFEGDGFAAFSTFFNFVLQQFFDSQRIAELCQSLHKFENCFGSADIVECYSVDTFVRLGLERFLAINNAGYYRILNYRCSTGLQVLLKNQECFERVGTSIEKEVGACYVRHVVETFPDQLCRNGEEYTRCLSRVFGACGADVEHTTCLSLARGYTALGCQIECKTPAPTSPPQFVCPRPDADFADPDRPCSRFYYWCDDDNKAELVACPAGLIFNPTIEDCDSLRNVAGCAAPTTAAPPEFVCPQPFGDFAHPDRPCTRFYYWCQRNQASLVECLDAKIYSAQRGECVQPRNAPDCLSSTPATPGFVCPVPFGDFPDPSRPCTMFYYWCERNRAQVVKCLEGTIFSAIKAECVTERDAPDCRPSTPLAPGFVCSAPFGDFPDPQQPCSKFYYWCQDNKPELVECLDDKIYSPNKQLCDVAENIPECTAPTSSSDSQCDLGKLRSCAATLHTDLGFEGDGLAGIETLFAFVDQKFFHSQRIDELCQSVHKFENCFGSADIVKCSTPDTFVRMGLQLSIAVSNAIYYRILNYQCSTGFQVLIKNQECSERVSPSIEGERKACYFRLLDQTEKFPDQSCRTSEEYTKCYSRLWRACGADAEHTACSAFARGYTAIGCQIECKSPAPSSPPQFICPHPDADFADPDRPCSRFYYWCDDQNKAELVACPAGLIFNTAIEDCDSLQNVAGCAAPTTTAPTRPPGFACPQPFGDFAHPDRPCTKFYYWCQRNQASLVECLDAKIYSAQRGECVQPRNAPDCLSSTPATPGFVCPVPFGDFPDPSRPCTMFYYWCQNNRAQVVKCLEGSVFSTIKGECVTERDALDCQPPTPSDSQCDHGKLRNCAASLHAELGFEGDGLAGILTLFVFVDEHFFYYNKIDELCQAVHKFENCFGSADIVECSSVDTFVRMGFDIEIARNNAFYYRKLNYACSTGLQVLVKNQECYARVGKSSEKELTACYVRLLEQMAKSRDEQCRNGEEYTQCFSRPSRVCGADVEHVACSMMARGFTVLGCQIECKAPAPSSPPQFICPRPDADFADPDRPCSKYYYWCDDQNKAELVTCPGEQIFNPTIQDCDVIRNVPQCAGTAESGCDFNKMSRCTLSFYGSIGLRGNGITDLESMISFVYKNFYQPGGVQKFRQLCRAVDDLENCFGSGFVDCLSVATFKRLGASEDTAIANTVFFRQQNYVCGTGRPVFERNFDCYVRTTIATENQLQDCLDRFVEQLTGSPRSVCSFAQEYTNCFIKPYAVCGDVQSAACGMMAAAFAFIPCPINCRAAPSPSRPTPTSTAATIAAPSAAPFLCPQADADFADPDRPCSKYYYWCDDQNRAELVSCPGDQIFNPVIHDCDVIRNVPQCGGAAESSCDFNRMSRCTLSFYSSIGFGGNGITDFDSMELFVYKNFYQPGGVQKFGQLCRAVHDLENCFGSGFVDCLSVATFKRLGASEGVANRNVVFFRQQNYVCGTGSPVFERNFDCYVRTSIATQNEAQECLDRFLQQLAGSPRDVCNFAQEYAECFIKPYAVCDDVQNAACGMMAAAFAYIPCPIICRAAPSQSSPDKFVCPRPDADFADPERPCTKYYYWCDDLGQAEIVRCPGSQIYSAALGDCADPRRVPQCPVASPTTTTAAPTSRPVPFLCPQADADFADPARPCSRFYYWCDDQNNAELVACPRDFIFNPAIKDCDAVQNVPGCAVTATPQKFVCPGPDADFADPERPCTKYYYWCDDLGQAEIVRCPGTQIYKPAIGDCAEVRAAPLCIP